MSETPKVPKENYKKQLLMAAILLIVAGLVIAVLSKLIVGGIIFLLGAVFGVGAQVTGNNPLSKD